MPRPKEKSSSSAPSPQPNASPHLEAPRDPPRKEKRLPLDTLVIGALLALAGAFAHFRQPQQLVEWIQLLPGTIERPLLDPLTYAALLVILIAERIAPAVPRQRSLNAGALQGVLYFFAPTPAAIIAVFMWLRVLDGLFEGSSGFLALDVGASWPTLLLIAVSLLIGDFLRWFHHWLRHKVPLFWKFRASHHSQREMNVFTDARFHPLDLFVAQTVGFLPFFVLGGRLENGVGEAALFALVVTWFPRFYHANVRGRWGPLRYLLVTPQSHRVHHSVEHAHADKNFGVIFSIWDRAFGTHCDDDVYPTTGVEDERVGSEQGVGPVAVVRSIFADMVYPFRPSR
jgi:sterol desaturase/sphingolipid hydroxylase (fatty acid hydroxylase superfamily)